MVKIDSLTNQRIVCDKYSGDIEYESKQGSDTIDNVTVNVVGAWTNKDGSTGGQKGPMRFPVANKFQGTDQGIEGERFTPINSIGQKSTYTRRRIRLKKMNTKDKNF